MVFPLLPFETGSDNACLWSHDNKPISSNWAEESCDKNTSRMTKLIVGKPSTILVAVAIVSLVICTVKVLRLSIQVNDSYIFSFDEPRTIDIRAAFVPERATNENRAIEFLDRWDFGENLGTSTCRRDPVSWSHRKVMPTNYSFGCPNLLSIL